MSGTRTNLARYEAYISSTAWAGVRRRYKQNYPWQCFCCKSKKRLHLHHTTYERLFKERLEDLVPLCEADHALVHKIVKAGKASLADAHILLAERGATIVPTTKKKKKKKKPPRKPRTFKVKFNAEEVICKLCDRIYPKHHPSLWCECGGFLRLISSTPESRISKLEQKQKKKEEERQRTRTIREKNLLLPRYQSKA